MWLGSQMCGNPMDLFTLLKTIHDSTNLFIESDTNELVHPKGLINRDGMCPQSAGTLLYVYMVCIIIAAATIQFARCKLD